jgi:hypothetical protein
MSRIEWSRQNAYTSPAKLDTSQYNKIYEVMQSKKLRSDNTVRLDICSSELVTAKPTTTSDPISKNMERLAGLDWRSSEGQLLIA